MQGEHIAFLRTFDQEDVLRPPPDHANQIDAQDIAQALLIMEHIQNVHMQYHLESVKKNTNK